MKTDIEKLKQAAFKLAEIAKRNSDDVDEWNDAIAAVEAFKPKAEPLERWVNVYPDGVYNFTHPTKEIAVKNSAEGLIRTAHLREVVPVEWVEWVVYEGRTITAKNGRLIYALPTIQEICAAHNAEMKRATGTEGK